MQPYGDIDDRVRSIAKALGFVRKSTSYHTIFHTLMLYRFI